jgi:hypothetical protein
MVPMNSIAALPTDPKHHPSIEGEVINGCFVVSSSSDVSPGRVAT